VHRRRFAWSLESLAIARSKVRLLLAGSNGRIPVTGRRRNGEHSGERRLFERRLAPLDGPKNPSAMTLVRPQAQHFSRRLIDKDGDAVPPADDHADQ
jgi:hypothetical protein